MKLKKASLFLTALSVFLFTGCVKYEGTLEIKDDKSMNYSIIYGIDVDYYDMMTSDKDIFDDEEIKEMKDNGYTVDRFNDDKYKGFKIEKSFKSIDDVSSSKDVEFKVSDMKNNGKMFKVTKGLIKNKYKAKFIFDSSDSSLSDSEDDDNEDIISKDESEDKSEDLDVSGNDNASNITTREGTDLETDSEEDSSDDMPGDFSDLENALTGSMDLSFNVKLPRKSISNNASSTNNDGKDLKWDLKSESNSEIEFEFELYNMTTIYALIGGGCACVILVIVLLVLILKPKNKKEKTEEVPTTPEVPTVEAAPVVPEVPTTPEVPAVEAAPVVPEVPTAPETPVVEVAPAAPEAPVSFETSNSQIQSDESNNNNTTI